MISNDFAVSNVRNAGSIFIHGISDAKKLGLNNDLPNIQFKSSYLNIDNIKFENGIPNLY